MIFLVAKLNLHRQILETIGCKMILSNAFDGLRLYF